MESRELRKVRRAIEREKAAREGVADAMREAHRAHSLRELANAVGMSPEKVRRIVKGLSWVAAISVAVSLTGTASAAVPQSAQQFLETVASGTVSVTCDFENEMAGEADPARREIHLYPDFCRSLAKFAQPGYRTRVLRGPEGVNGRIAVAYALGTSSHEAYHVRYPEASEAEVECLSVRSVLAFARHMGAGALLAKRLLEQAQQIHRGRVEAYDWYRLPGCQLHSQFTHSEIAAGSISP